MRDFEEELIALCEFDQNYAKQKLDQVKSNYKKQLGNLKSKEDYLALFHEFPLIQCVITVLFNYQMMMSEFEHGENPFYGTTTELKKHPKNLTTVLKQFYGALEISKKLSDSDTVYRLERTILLFKSFLDNPSDLLAKLHFFEILNSIVQDKNHALMPLILYYNPFNDPLIEKFDDCSYYLEMLKFFDGFDVNQEIITRSTFIKIHKLFEIDNPSIYSQLNSPSEPIKSIFEKLGKEDQNIDLKRLKNVVPRTYFKGIAIFDYSKGSDFLFNKYLEYAHQNAIKDSIIQEKLRNNKIDIQVQIKIQEVFDTSMKKMYRQLLEF